MNAWCIAIYRYILRCWSSQGWPASSPSARWTAPPRSRPAQLGSLDFFRACLELSGFVRIFLDLSGFVLVCLGDCPTQLSFVHFAVCSCQLCFITIPYWVIWKKQSRAICWVCLACNCSSSQQGFNEIKASLKFFLTKCWLERQDGKKTPHTIHELASAQNFSDLLADQLSSYGGAQLTIQSSPYRPL